MTNATALDDLIKKLHEVNQQLSEAARPLDRLSYLDDRQRDAVGKELRAGLERWDRVTWEISRAISAE